MEIKEMVDALKTVLADTMNEEQIYRLSQAWLVILRDAYSKNPKQFSDEQINFLKRIRACVPRLKRFIEIQEELIGSIDLQEYSQAMQELTAMNEKFKDFAVVRRVKKR